jgi:putative NADPH-quinone reductase
MNILVVTAHPLKNSLCGLFSETVTGSLTNLGHAVHSENLYMNQFDRVLSIDERMTYYKESYDSSKVSEEMERLVNSDALVLIFPTWWFGFPENINKYVKSNLSSPSSLEIMLPMLLMKKAM